MSDLSDLRNVGILPEFWRVESQTAVGEAGMQVHCTCTAAANGCRSAQNTLKYQQENA
jgi:hypothetical protein